MKLWRRRKGSSAKAPTVATEISPDDLYWEHAQRQTARRHQKRRKIWATGTAGSAGAAGTGAPGCSAGSCGGGGGCGGGS